MNQPISTNQPGSPPAKKRTAVWLLSGGLILLILIVGALMYGGYLWTRTLLPLEGRSERVGPGEEVILAYTDNRYTVSARLCSQIQDNCAQLAVQQERQPDRTIVTMPGQDFPAGSAQIQIRRIRSDGSLSPSAQYRRYVKFDPTLVTTTSGIEVVGIQSGQEGLRGMDGSIRYYFTASDFSEESSDVRREPHLVLNYLGTPAAKFEVIGRNNSVVSSSNTSHDAATPFVWPLRLFDVTNPLTAIRQQAQQRVQSSDGTEYHYTLRLTWQEQGTTKETTHNLVLVETAALSPVLPSPSASAAPTLPIPQQ